MRRAGLCEFAAQGKPWARCPSKCFAPRYARQMMATFVSVLKYDLSDLVLVLSLGYTSLFYRHENRRKKANSGINLLDLPLKSLEINIFEALFLN